MRQLLIIFYLLVTVLIGATGDALDASGTQTWGHLLGAVELLLMAGVCFLFEGDSFKQYVKNFLLILLTYMFIRIFAFDYMYNLVRGNSLSYLGGHNWWDMWWSEVVKIPPYGLLFVRSVFLIAGCSIPFKYLR